MTGENIDPANSNAGDRRNDILELARVIREADNQKTQLPKVQVPLFDGTNASAWADKFEQLGSCCEWSSEKMLQMVKRYCMVKYKEEVSELVQASRDWPDFKAKLLDKYQLGDQLLDLADLRKVSRRKFGTAKQFLTEFERVARLVPDLPDKDRCLIFLENFSKVEQRELMRDMTGRYDWPKIKENLLAGSFDQMLYRLLKQQKEDREKEGVSADKDQAVYKTLTDMLNIMADMKEERLKLQVMMVQTKGGKRKGKAPVVEEVSDSSSEEEDEEEEEPPRKLTKAERKALNQIRGGQGTRHLMATTVLSRPAFKRPATAGLPQARKARRPPRPRAAPEEGPSQPRKTETVSIEEDDGEEDELLRAENERQAKQRVMERESEMGKADIGEGELKKKKQVYTIPVEQGLDIEQIVDRILESQRDLFTLKEFLAASPKIREEFRHRLSRKKVMTVKMSDIFPQEISSVPPGTKMDWHCVATGLLKVQIGPCEYSAFIDDGAEMNIIREREAMGARVNINRADTGFLVGASGITPFCGTTSDVTVQSCDTGIGGNVVRLESKAGLDVEMLSFVEDYTTPRRSHIEFGGTKA
ncbi:hypothetical protein CBR_g23526 [Chara braunii]|uniref:Peptidase A2 domain-containing protein n=1 Tax=Chara braunii TaxID=69332 RepID=A0A388L4G5_CHABU|nr:hypothetical protein CBR_g23526 [Chara braunii]|eukprot:GBG77200.1 hypothetical protein CBR_g23526 [Chara braunii]